MCTAQVLKKMEGMKKRERQESTHKESDRIATMNEEEEKKGRNVGGLIEGLYGQRVESPTAQTMEWLVRE